jgi:hypothetical protein
LRSPREGASGPRSDTNLSRPADRDPACRRGPERHA